MELKGNLLYGQSGGPSSVINSSAFGVLDEALKHKDVIEHIYCAHYGVDGILHDDLILIDNYTHEELNLLTHTPGAAFGSVRHKLKDYNEDKSEYEQILALFKKYNIRFFFYNGGNDSMDTCYKIDKFFKKVGYDCRVLGIPKTIDNDLPLTDHTPGFGSAAKYVANTFAELAYDGSAYAKGRVNIIEIMGRNAGWLTAASYLACKTGYGPDLIYLPEVPFDIDKFYKDVQRIYAKNHKVFVAVSEGIRDANGDFVAGQKTKDAFGHSQMGGVGAYLASFLKDKGLKTRAIELSLPQRSAAHLSSLTDVNEAIEVGREAVRRALQNETSKMLCIRRLTDKPYEVTYFTADLESVANVEKTVPLNLITEDNNFLKEEISDYLLPLIQGENHSVYENGMVKLFKLHN